jgi:hypothetical protein
MDVSFEVRHAGSPEIKRQFTHFFSKIPWGKGGTTGAPGAEEVEHQASALQALIDSMANADDEFKLPTLAQTQTYFISKFLPPRVQPRSAALGPGKERPAGAAASSGSLIRPAREEGAAEAASGWTSLGGLEPLARGAERARGAGAGSAAAREWPSSLGGVHPEEEGGEREWVPMEEAVKGFAAHTWD